MIIVGWIALSLLVWFLALGRGRSGFGWCLLALAISPLLAGILLLVLTPVSSRVEADKIASGELRRCPMCAELIQPEAVKCRYCGSSVEAIPAGSADEEAQRRYGG